MFHKNEDEDEPRKVRRNLPGKEGEDGLTHVQETSRNPIKLEQREQAKIIGEP